MITWFYSRLLMKEIYWYLLINLQQMHYQIIVLQLMDFATSTML